MAQEEPWGRDGTGPHLLQLLQRRACSILDSAFSFFDGALKSLPPPPPPAAGPPPRVPCISGLNSF